MRGRRRGGRCVWGALAVVVYSSAQPPRRPRTPRAARAQGSSWQHLALPSPIDLLRRLRRLRAGLRRVLRIRHAVRGPRRLLRRRVWRRQLRVRGGLRVERLLVGRVRRRGRTPEVVGLAVQRPRRAAGRRHVRLRGGLAAVGGAGDRGARGEVLRIWGVSGRPRHGGGVQAGVRQRRRLQVCAVVGVELLLLFIMFEFL